MKKLSKEEILERKCHTCKKSFKDSKVVQFHYAKKGIPTVELHHIKCWYKL